ncbi:glycosyltransferase family 4 protein [Bacillus mobilis]|uniref:glycosyltransferase family 4 protein n=1 Tax=Bacillus mobilis TaxID=2026190 RepID=UPI0022E7AEAE|nr:glycosyltransferase family 1 protein [Bacillus mobilis]
MKRVAIDVRMIGASGIGVYIQNILPFIVRELPQYEFILLGKKEELSDLLELENTRVVECSSGIYSLSEQWEIRKKLPKDIDLFWAPHYNVPLLYRGKLLVTIHDVFHLAMPEFVKGIEKKIYAKFVFNHIKKKASAIMTVSEFTKNEIVKYIGIEKNIINVIYNGVEESWFNNEETFLNEESNKYLIYVGNVKPHKNLSRLLEAFNLLKDTIPHDLIIVGKQEGFITGDNNITQQAKKLEGRIKFTGAISDQALKRYVKNAEALIFPSLYEGFGLPPLEAMASNTPVIASNIIPVREVCQDAAIYFDPLNVEEMAEKILTVVTNESLARELIIKGNYRAQYFNWKNSAQKVVEVIEEVLSKK